ncbi:ABC-2 transporter permease [Bacillus sp. FJAT-50079]|uniref:ABC-2 transporter permease n=1 Tax=Bacillus sp. FJAT-50079 TaxID=2833577 RepID=UPI001BCA462B|nr:ABC-2 transporter permease [Bacillus sp. FJAT-50079]MBS4209238.1 ABC-2 transporter permease [Bacillus sp. FJAT-50079]
MIQLIKADLKSTKILAYVAMIPAVIVLAFFAHIFNVSPFYSGISLIALGLSFESFTKQKKDGIQPLILSLPVTRKDYIAAKYIIFIPWFLIATVIMTIWFLLIEKGIQFFNFKLWIFTFFITLTIAALFFIIHYFANALALILFVFFISLFVTLDISEGLTMFFSSFSSWLIYPSAILLSYLSYLIIVTSFAKKNLP